MNPEENPYEEKLSPSIVSHYNFSQVIKQSSYFMKVKITVVRDISLEKYISLKLSI